MNRKRSLNGAWTFALILAAVAVIPVTVALKPLPPSGYYLHGSNYHLVSYDNATGGVVDLGPAVFPTTTSLHCNDSASDPRSFAILDNPAQCGDCVYAPPQAWQTPGQYTAGRCVTSQADGSSNTITARADIRLVGGPGEAWGYSIRGFAINGDWFSAELQRGLTTDGSGGCRAPITTALGTIYYCSSTFSGAPGSYQTSNACEEIRTRWLQTHPGSPATCEGNSALWVQTSATTARERLYGPLSGHDQQASQYASACC